MSAILAAGAEAELADLLIPRLRSADPLDRACAAGCLGRLGPRAIAAAEPLTYLVAGVLHPTEVRITAAYAIGKIGEAAETRVVLEHALAHPHAPFAGAAASALARLGRVDAPVLAALDTVLRQGDDSDLVSTLATVQHLGSRAAPLVSVLAHLLASRPLCTHELVRALDAIGPPAAAAADAIRPLTAAGSPDPRLVTDQDLRLRVAAAEALLRIEGPGGPLVDVAQGLLKHGAVREDAVRLLARLGAEARHAVPAPEEQLAENNLWAGHTGGA
jgi:hypothetical protein